MITVSELLPHCVEIVQTRVYVESGIPVNRLVALLVSVITPPCPLTIVHCPLPVVGVRMPE